MVKALAIDIDGTFLGNNGEFLQDNVEILRHLLSNGIKIVFASGRTTTSIRKISRAICRRSIPLIAFNGAILAIGSRKPVNIKFNGRTAAEVVERLLQKGIYVQAFINDNIIVSELSSEAVEYSLRSGTELLVRKRLHRVVSITPPTKLLARFNRDDFPMLVDECSSTFDGIQFINEKPGVLEIFPEGVSKLSALKVFCTENEISLSEIAAFGDGILDAEMIAHAGIGVAMGNASEEVMAVADIVAPSNAECGLYYSIREIISSGHIELS